MTTSEEIKALQLKINNQIKHKYLQHFLPAPHLDRDLLGIYHAVFRQNDNNKDTWLDQASSAILVHMALATHEQISDEALTGNRQEKERQLTVLAGDYYSSLYYYLLSQIENIELIKWLAKGIQSFNNAKMHFFGDQSMNWQQRFRFLFEIETTLTRHIMEGLGLDPWKEPVSLFLYLQRLFTEQTSLIKKDTGQGYFKHLFKSNESLAKTAKTAIDKEVRRVEQDIHRMFMSLSTPATLLDELINRMLERFQMDTITRVEEG